MKHIAIPFALLSLGIAASAQAEQLKKEITIDRDIVPELRPATPPSIFPQIVTLDLKGKAPRIALYTGETAPGGEFAILSPATPASPVGVTPWRGYVRAEYGIPSNLSLSAGYAILSDTIDRLNVWTQINNAAYRSRLVRNLEKGRFHQFNATLGADYSHRFTESRRLTISLDGGCTGFNDPYSVFQSVTSDRYSIETQGIAHADLQAAWHSDTPTRWSIGAYGGFFNFTKSASLAPESTVIEPLHQSQFGLTASVARPVKENQEWHVNLDARFLNFNHILDTESDNLPSKTVGNIALHPGYRFSTHNFEINAGARLDITFNSGKTLHIAPEILLATNPVAGFGAWLNLGGGQELADLRMLTQYTPCLLPLLTQTSYNQPVNGRLGLRFGPFRGASITLGLSYAAANSPLLPASYRGHTIMLTAPDLRAWKAEATINWRYNRLLSVEATFESRLSNDEKGVWLAWADRARQVITAGVAVRPIEPLTIDLSWQMRLHRSMPDIMAADADDTPGLRPGEIDLRDSSLLNASATYAISDALSVSLRGENLLNKRSFITPLLPAQGLTAYIGASYKF